MSITPPVGMSISKSVPPLPLSGQSALMHGALGPSLHAPAGQPAGIGSLTAPSGFVAKSNSLVNVHTDVSNSLSTWGALSPPVPQGHAVSAMNERLPCDKVETTEQAGNLDGHAVQSVVGCVSSGAVLVFPRKGEEGVIELSLEAIRLVILL